MKTASAPLQAFLLAAPAEFYVADLFTITLVDGTILRLTDRDSPVTYSGNVFAVGPFVKRSKIKTVTGLQVDTMDIDFIASPAHMIGSTAFLIAVQQGKLDGATVKVERLFMPTLGDTSLGTIILFRNSSGTPLNSSGIGRPFCPSGCHGASRFRSGNGESTTWRLL